MPSAATHMNLWEMLLRCNGAREPSWSTDGHCCGPPAARRNSAHWWWNRRNRGWCRPDYPSRMWLRTCGLLRPGSSGILARVGLKQSPLRRFCEDGFLSFRAKTAIPGLIEGMPAKRGIGADRRLSLTGMPVLKPGLVLSRSYSHSPLACSSPARSNAHRWQIVTPMCSNCWRGVPDLPQRSHSVGSPSSAPTSSSIFQLGKSPCGVVGLPIMRL